MRSTALLLLAVAACAGSGPAAPMDESGAQWTGPAAHAQFLANGDLRVSLTAPTGGCALDLLDVQSGDDTTDVRVRYRKPDAEVVTQVLTPLQVTVAAGRLAAARTVRVWISVAAEPAALAATLKR
jgi:hypothetical protein